MVKVPAFRRSSSGVSLISHQQLNHEWIQPKRQGFQLACCDCGLIHNMNFRTVERSSGRIMVQFQASRNAVATGEHRKHYGIKVKRKKVHGK